MARGIYGSATRVRGFFICLREMWSNKSHGQGWDVRTGLFRCSLIPCGAAYGLDFAWVAWRISKTDRSANRTQAATVWARAASKAFNSIKMARSGPQPKVG